MVREGEGLDERPHTVLHMFDYATSRSFVIFSFFMLR